MNADLMHELDAIAEAGEADADRGWWQDEEPTPMELRRAAAFLGEYTADEVAPVSKCIAEWEPFACNCEGCLAEHEQQQAYECAAEAANEAALYGSDFLAY